MIVQSGILDKVLHSKSSDVKVEDLSKKSWDDGSKINVDYENYYVVSGKSGLNPNMFPEVEPTEVQLADGSSTALTMATPVYSALDELGRTRDAITTITYDSIQLSKGWREKWEKDHYPSGWFIYEKDGQRVTENEYLSNKRGVSKISNNSEVNIELSNGKFYKGHFYNASHLIADSLGGRAFRNNVVTATRTQNVGNNDKKGGMQYIEWKVLNYITDHPDIVVYYQVTPVYTDSELLPRVVEVRALSSDGVLDEYVITYNYAKGFSDL